MLTKTLIRMKLLIAIVLTVSFMTIIYADEDTELTEDEFTSQEKILPLTRIMNKMFCINRNCCKKIWWGSLSCHPCASCRHLPFIPHANYDGTRAPSHNPLQYQGGTPSHKPQYQDGTSSHKPQYQGGTPSHSPQHQGK